VLVLSPLGAGPIGTIGIFLFRRDRAENVIHASVAAACDFTRFPALALTLALVA
jgi:AMMECR1 domain-containing protein